MTFRLPTFGPGHMVFAVAIVLLGLFGYAALQTLAQTAQLNEAERALRAEVVDLRYQRDELRGIRDYLATDEYVESFARERFGFVRPGEIAVVIEAPEPVRPAQDPHKRWWQNLFGR